MKILVRHLLIAALPLVCGLAARYGFEQVQGSCYAMVGPLFSSKCHGRQLEYQLLAQTLGTAFGALIVGLVGFWLEVRRRRVVNHQDPSRGDL